MTIQSTSWSSIDSAQPWKSFVNPAGDAPIGARTDHGRKHVSKSYFTFDLSGLSGAKVVAWDYDVLLRTLRDFNTPTSPLMSFFSDPPSLDKYLGDLR